MSKVELEVLPGGEIVTMFDEKVNEVLKEAGAEVTNVERASHVEWDKQLNGWTVVSASDPSLAVRMDERQWFRRYRVAKEGPLAVFESREKALQIERMMFRELIAPAMEAMK